MNTDLTKKLEELEANLATDGYRDGNYVMTLLKEVKTLAINYTEDKNKHFKDGYRQGYRDSIEDSNK